MITIGSESFPREMCYPNHFSASWLINGHGVIVFPTGLGDNLLHRPLVLPSLHGLTPLPSIEPVDKSS